MKKINFLTVATIALLSFFMNSCSAIGGIFKTGVGVGIFIVVGIIVLILIMIFASGKK